MRKYIVLFLFVISALSIWAENASNVRVRQEGMNIVVTYDLKDKSSVRLLMASGTSNEYVELTAVSGDVGKTVLPGNGREIIWDPLAENDRFVAKNVRFKVEAMKNKIVKTHISGQVGYSLAPQLSYGGMIGQMYKGIGWYISGRSNFQFGTPEVIGSCDESGAVDGVKPFYSGNTHTTHWVAHAGIMMNVLERVVKNRWNNFGFYIGAGYGKRELLAQTAKGDWVKYAPTSHTGISGNVGLFGSVYGVTLNVGASSINFKNLEFEAGIGITF